ncbi:hypothetical protein vB_PsyM_KIL3b_0165 [Pseudomonas phage vB_PsyM_KIL3b]|uniref:Uncharacterized protein n=3 Tax=Pseudomonas phage vB_PsyM_KIL1 TaxID=1777065 RepID=A0A142IEB6_9CAUD|nr:hypothetical protein vB_PsyM_KIL2_0171 [Pseudomonas phage vB_PsyM_KIL2]AMR57732.1 hypothetical protein vB_PsyM_KIL3_0165 [Pseudomonas phage vB_PsyM_KIL3]AMR58230.1 hypothetical protein vB_PsyM_KIL3b_0165 [Pseudomonas phage vB_PsyM_KIL3b]
MSFKFVTTTETLTPPHYPEFEHQPSRTVKRRSQDIGFRGVAQHRDAQRVKACGCKIDTFCEICSYE